MLIVATNTFQVGALLGELERRTGDLRAVMENIGGALENNIRNRFETATDPAGRPWAEWKPATAASYPAVGTAAAAREGPGAGLLLIRHGHMLDGASYRAGARQVRVGFDQDYAWYHEGGTEKMARRGLLFDDPEEGTLGRDDEQAILDLAELHLRRAAGA